ncbi:MAG: hypothetical protein WC835_02200 [Candidatus Paceibacterota bacterium]|jgi:hypothetical protein
MNGNLKKILIAVVIIVVLFFVYRFFFAGSGPVAALKIETAQSSASAQAGKDFLVALLNLQHINLDAGSAILEDGDFIRLRDMSVSLPDEPQGRPNPFRPLGEDSTTPISPVFQATSTPAATSTRSTTP